MLPEVGCRQSGSVASEPTSLNASFLNNVVKNKAYLKSSSVAPVTLDLDRPETSYVTNMITKKAYRRASAVVPGSSVCSVPESNFANVNTKKPCIKTTKEEGIFRLIFTSALIIGLPVYPLFIRSTRAANFLKTWCIAVFCIRSILVVFECLYNYMFWPSIATRYSFTIHCLIGYAILMDFLLRRRKITSSVKKLTDILSNIFSSSSSTNWSVKLYMFLCFFLFSTYYALGIYFFFYQFWDPFTKLIHNSAPFAEDGYFLYYYDWIVLLAEVTSYHNASATLFLASSIIGYSYLITGTLLKLCGQRIKEDIKSGHVSATTISRNLVKFMRIFRCIEEIDGNFNVSVFLIYAAVLDGAYFLVSSLLTANAKYDTIEVQLLVMFIFLSTILKFIFITLCGEYVVSQAEVLRNDLIEISDLVSDQPNRSMHMFSVLCMNIRTVEISMTGLKYFEITRKIFPSVIGMVTTYGQMIYTLGAMDDL